MTRNRHRPIIAAAALLCLGACSTGIQLARDEAGNPGQLLFNGYAKDGVACYKCHNGNGRGTWKAPALTGVEFALSDEEIRDAIRKGPGMMPAFGDKLTDEELGQVLSYVKSL
ncbi:MAG: cytochrome c [Planctomycetota bacterium]